jgi:YegS/Rv2252/BmrU family lipid kinase
MPPLLVLSNAAAGGVDSSALDAALATLGAGGTPAHYVPLSDPGELAAVLDQHPDHRPIAVGGDGTLHLLVAALHSRDQLTDRVVGLVPMGTGNDFARAAGIPDDPVAAAEIVLHGRPQRLDLLTDNHGGVVINAVHLGIGAQAAQDGAPMKPLLGRTAYRLGALLAGIRNHGWSLDVIVDGRALTHGQRVLQVCIGNGRTIGGGTPLTPDARPDDGLADIMISTATGPIARFRYAQLLRDGKHLTHPAVKTIRGRVIEITGEPTPINADGELAEPIDHRCWTVQPGAWQLTVPTHP